MGKLKARIIDNEFEEVVEAYNEGLLSDEEFRRISISWFDRYYGPLEIEQAED